MKIADQIRRMFKRAVHAPEREVEPHFIVGRSDGSVEIIQAVILNNTIRPVTPIAIAKGDAVQFVAGYTEGDKRYAVQAI
jgi:hypothetical protein